MMNIGYKIPIPPKTKGKEWEVLQKKLISEKAEAASESRFQNAQLIHTIEKELRKLEALPVNKGREVLIKQLKKGLKVLAHNQSFLSPLRGWDVRLSPTAPKLGRYT